MRRTDRVRLRVRPPPRRGAADGPRVPRPVGARLERSSGRDARTGTARGPGAPRRRDAAPVVEKFPEVAVTETVTEGRAGAELVRASTGASLVVVGRRTRDSRLGTRIGPVTHAVLHHVRCPVAVVPHA
ncbi:universal stress protein [Streptomyces sp. NPDC002845]